jgi:hypothetical protein
LHGGGVHITLGASVGVGGVEVRVQVKEGGAVAVHVGTSVVISGVEVEGTCTSGVDSGDDSASIFRVMTTGCDWPVTPWTLKALTTMTWVPGISLCQDCETM